MVAQVIVDVVHSNVARPFSYLVPEGMRPGDQAALCLRMERLCYGSRAPEGHWSLPATLVEHRFAGGSLRTTLTAPDGQTLTAFSQTRPELEPGAPVRIWWDERHAAVIP